MDKIIHIDLEATEDGQGGFLSDWLEKLQKSLQKASASLAKSMGRITTAAGTGLGAIAQAYNQIFTGSKSTQAALKRTVASFDELNRLNKRSGSAGASQTLQVSQEALEKAQLLVKTLKEKIIEPLQQLPQMGLQEALQQVGNGILGLLGITDQGAASTNQFADSVDQAGAGMELWNFLIRECNGLADTFWGKLILGALSMDTASQSMEGLCGQTQAAVEGFQGLNGAALAGLRGVMDAWEGTGQWFENQVTSPMARSFSGFFADLQQLAADSSGHSKGIFSDLSGHFCQEFSGAWQRISAAFGQGGQVFDQVEGGVLTGLKTMVNSLITGVNRVSFEPFSGLNTVLDKLQNIKLGNLQPFSFLTWRASVPKIPYLAQGAVLPANKPFLAMVGDQRHGTNIEAPLATIQEALALTMDDYAQGNLAGHAQTAQLLDRLLEAVRSISLADEKIARACDRHHAKMAIMNGQ